MRRATTRLAIGLVATLWVPVAAGQERGLQKVVAEPDSPLTLSIRVQTKEGSALRSLADGETLRTGDVIQFMVAVDRPAYVYIVQYFADGSAAVLHPEGGDAQLKPGYEARIPEPGQVFKLVPPAGAEVVYFIASQKTLGEADVRVAEALRVIRAVSASPPAPSKAAMSATAPGAGIKGERPAPAGPPAPSAFGLGTRGRLVKVPAGGSPPISIQAGADGVAIYAFTIRHQAAP
jgi:hypothetical protein